MRERIPTNTDKNTSETIDLEKGKDGVWRQLEKAAPAEVAKLINNIDGFDLMSPQDQISTLNKELVVIAQRGDNNERYIFKVLGNKIKEMELYEKVSEIKNEISKLGTKC